MNPIDISHREKSEQKDGEKNNENMLTPNFYVQSYL